MAKTKQNPTLKHIKRLLNYLTVSAATLYGAYWVVMGITNATPSWGDTVGNIILVVLILGAIGMGFTGAIQSIQDKD